MQPSFHAGDTRSANIYGSGWGSTSGMRAAPKAAAPGYSVGSSRI